MKLPEKLYEPKHSKELRSYAKGWNYVIDYAKDVLNKHEEEEAKEFLSDMKKFSFKRTLLPFFEARYDCILEIEKLNEEKEETRTWVGDFMMFKDKYICFDEDYTCPLFNRDKWKCQYCINTKTDKCPLLLL